MNPSTILPSSKEIKKYNNACKKGNDITSKYGSIKYTKLFRKLFWN